MKILMCTRDLNYGEGSYAKLLLQEFEKIDEIEKILFIGPRKLSTFSPKMRFMILKQKGKYFITKRPYFAVKCRRMIEQILKIETYDVIHITSQIIAKNFGIPLIMTFGSLGYFAFKDFPAIDYKIKIADLLHRIYEFIDISTMKHSAKIIFVSKKTLDMAKSRYKKESQKFVYLPNFVDTSKCYPIEDNRRAELREKYGLSQNKKYILFVGRVDVFKGVLDLAHAVKAIQSKHEDVELVIAGDGPLRKQISKFDFIKCLGRIPHEDMNEVYNISDIFVLPSLYENLPATVLEAMSCGLPVISTNTGDTKEVVNDDRMITNISDPTDIEQKIQFVLNLPKKDLDKIKERNRLRVIDHYDIKNARRVLEVYKEVTRN